MFLGFHAPLPKTIKTDIYKNCPRIIQHTQQPNTEQWIGTEMEVLVAGNWTTYKSRVVQYLQQLAIITPYACFEMSYMNRMDEKKGMNLRFERRSEQMPAQAREVKHHPSSVRVSLMNHSLSALLSIYEPFVHITMSVLYISPYRSTTFWYNSFWKRPVPKHY